MEKLKGYWKTFIGFVMLVISIILIVLKLKQSDIDEADLKDSFLEGQESKVDEDIEELEDKLDDPVEDLDSDDVEDYWNGRL